MSTVVIDNKYNGKNLFTIAKEKDLDSEGSLGANKYPVISMGLKKAQAILEHVEELKTYVITEEG